MDSAILKATLNGMKFLVVDDEPDNIGVLVKLLTILGAKVTTAEDGAQGLEQARSSQPDVILADLSMPVMTGWEMLYNLKQDEALKAIPVIALTAHAMAGDRQRVLDAGFTAYVPKPIDIPKFIPEIVSILKEIPQTAVQLPEK